MLDDTVQFGKNFNCFYYCHSYWMIFFMLISDLGDNGYIKQPDDQIN